MAVNDESESEEVDYDTNLLSLGADAWDDSALVDAFNRDLKFYKKSHSNQLIDLSKVSNMINFKKAKKINQNITKQINEEPEDEEEDEEQDDDDDDDDDSKDDIILAPSFIPFADKNTSKQTQINKYSSWPPQQTQMNQQNTYTNNVNKNKNKNKKRKHKRKKQKQTENENDDNFVETENLAKLYQQQQLREQKQQQSSTQPQPQSQSQSYPYQQYGYPPPPPQPQPAYGYYNPYEHGGYSRPQSPHSHYYRQQPPMPMPPYARSGMFNMGLNMMPPPAMSKKPTRDEALANMLLAWYWNGYYTGYQAAMEHKQ